MKIFEGHCGVRKILLRHVLCWKVYLILIMNESARTEISQSYCAGKCRNIKTKRWVVCCYLADENPIDDANPRFCSNFRDT